MGLIFLYIFIFLSSCVSPDYRPMPPIEAGIPELPFSYLSNGIWRETYGHGSARFSEGDTKKFKIDLFSDEGDCILRVINGDVDTAINCSNKKEIELDLGKYKKSEPEVLSFVVTYQNLGSQVGYFYPSLAKERPTLDVSYICPYQAQNGGFSVCTRPATYRFLYRLNFNDPVSGKFIHRRQCVGQPLEETIFESSGPFEREFELNSPVPTYCVIGIGEKNTGKSHVIHVRFYDPKYIPLLPPYVKKTASASKVCANDKYDALSINKTYQTKLNKDECTSAVFYSPLLIFAWDKFGRFSFLEHSDVYFYNGWNFYAEAKDYAFEQIKKTCGSVVSRECLNNNERQLMYSEKVIKAVEMWDSSILYQM